jgi:hypothetical protein
MPANTPLISLKNDTTFNKHVFDYNSRLLRFARNDNVVIARSAATKQSLAVEMADVADDRAVLHMAHVVDRDHVDVASGMLPVAVTKTSACAAASSIVVTW